jgi:type II secretory pathway pseudopilin PulG
MNNSKGSMVLAAFCALVLFALVPCSSAVPEKGGEAKPQLNLIRFYPEDALFAGSMKVEGMETLIDRIGNLIRTFGGDQEFKEFTDGIAKVNTEEGIDIRAQVANIANEAGILLDVNNIDSLVGAVGQNKKTAPQMILRNCFVLFGAKDPALFDSLMEKIAQKGGIKKEIVPRGELQIQGFHVQEKDVDFSFYYTHYKGTVLFGFSDETLVSIVQRSKGGANLSASPDYQRVFKHLSRNPDSWGYLNLPKLVRLVSESVILQGLIASKPEAQNVFQYVKGLEKDLSGAGWTSYRTEGVVIQQSCMPAAVPSLTGGAGSVGILSAIAVPNLLNAVQRGKQKRTMSDMRSVGVAVESFIVDNGKAPGPTTGYVPVEQMKAKLQPTYIKLLPTQDAWGDPLLYWSNEQEYIVRSDGKDGRQDEEYGEKIEPGATNKFTNDIIYSNGQFIRWPEGTQE